jgi:hypothetical protein
MNTRIVTTTPRIELSCGHFQSLIALDTSGLERRKDGWYAAHRCLKCKRKKAVVMVDLGKETLL